VGNDDREGGQEITAKGLLHNGLNKVHFDFAANHVL
jgi:hypothetical protein